MIKHVFLAVLLSQLGSLANNASAEEAKVPLVQGENFQDVSAGKKKILDMIRQGVVIIQTKAFASTTETNKGVWSGTGFIVDKEKGLIVTNKHVVGDLSVCSYTIKFADGTTTDAHLKYADPLYDFAFLSLDTAKLPPETIALELNETPASINETIYAMGNSAGDEFSTYLGTISSVYENIGPFAEQSFKFSGLTVPGASGSPVFDQQGKVVGIIYGGKLISGLALPINYIQDAFTYLKKGETPPRKSLGITCEYTSLVDIVSADLLSEQIKSEYSKAFPQSHNRILIISDLMVNSPAQKVFKSGDILWAINGTLIGPNLYKIDQIVNEVSINQEVSVQVYRQGKLMEIKIKPYLLSPQANQSLVTFADVTWFGANEFVRLMVGDPGPGVYIKTAAPTSPFKKIVGESWMEERLLKIISLNGMELNSLDDLAKVISTLSKKTMLVVKYIDFLGVHEFGRFISADRQERVAILKYESQFDTPKIYQMDEKTLEWKATEIKFSSPK